MALAGQVTNPERLEGRDVSFQSDGTAINGYLVKPREPGSYPGIIVIHEAWGVIEHIRDVARRFANLGYIVLAPDLYTRVGAPKTDDPMNVVLSRMLALSDAQLVRDLDKAADLLAAQPGITGKIGCVGFCMGGSFALQLAVQEGGKIAAAVAFYPTAYMPDDYAGLQAPVLIHIPDADQINPPTLAEELNEKISADTGRKPEIDHYPAGHAFLNEEDLLGTYDAEQASIAWDRTVAFLRAHLG